MREVTRKMKIKVLIEQEEAKNLLWRKIEILEVKPDGYEIHWVYVLWGLGLGRIL